jgi:hypothetical protein
MAVTEIERLALYWPQHAIDSLRADEKANTCSTESPLVGIPERLNGGCLLYRIGSGERQTSCNLKTDA